MKILILLACLCLGICDSLAQGSWTVVADSIQGHPPVAAAFLNEFYGFVKTDSMLYRTLDGGKNWFAMPQVPWESASEQFYFYRPDDIFIGGIFESRDSGMSWQPVGSPRVNDRIYILGNTFYDAGGYSSNNHGKTWQAASGWSSDCIIGNLDSNLAQWGNGNASTLFSTDQGITWNGGKNGPPTLSGYAIPYSSIFFRGDESNPNGIGRSVDGGKTWFTPAGNGSNAYTMTGAILGDGNVIYAQATDYITTTNGMLRSVDSGRSWQLIGGPSGLRYHSIAGVCKGGSVCFALNSHHKGVTGTIIYGPLYKYYDSTLFHPVAPNIVLDKLFDSTVNTTDCDSAQLRLRIAFKGVGFIRYDGLTISGLPKYVYKTNYSESKNIRIGFTDTAVVNVLPLPLGTYNVKINVHLTSSDWIASDTAINATIVVASKPPILHITAPQMFDFGTSRTCSAGGKDSLILSNPSCESVTISDVRIEADTNSTGEFTIMKPSATRVNSAVPPQKYFIAFKAIHSGTKSANLILESSIGFDTIPVRATVEPDSSKVEYSKPTTISYPASPLCTASRNDTILLSNRGCNPLRINTIRLEQDPALPNEYGITAPTGYPLNFKSPNGKIFISFHPHREGNPTARLIIETVSQIDTFTISASVLPDTCTTMSAISGHVNTPLDFTITANVVAGLSLRLKDHAHQEVAVQIFDILGKRYFNVTMPASQDNLNVNSRNFSAGVYTIRLQSGGVVVSKRVMVVQ
ncbi:MAG: T9SS type A sorting domain-containing protein [bacterium]